MTTALGELVDSGKAAGEAAADSAARPSDGWRIVHVLYGNCGCSRRVAKYLLTPERSPLVEEWVLLVEDAPESKALGGLHDQLMGAGFRVHPVAPDALHDRFSIESAPLFVVLGPAKQVRFLGGYTERKQGLNYQDIDTLDQLRAGTIPTALPVFGCGVSNALQTTLDPLKIKY